MRRNMSHFPRLPPIGEKDANPFPFAGQGGLPGAPGEPGMVLDCNSNFFKNMTGEDKEDKEDLSRKKDVHVDNVENVDNVDNVAKKSVPPSAKFDMIYPEKVIKDIKKPDTGYHEGKNDTL
jgi:hypothetical protein